MNNVMAVGGSYIYRKYDRFFWNDRYVSDAAGNFIRDWTSADYVAVPTTPTGCPAGARCEPYTYYQPSSPLPARFTYTNVPDRWRTFNGIELTFQKRMANRWSMNASYAYNDAVDTWDSPAAYEDPTCTVTSCLGSQIYAPEAGGSGIDNVYINAKWLMKVSGTYMLPADINVAMSYNVRQGYPFPQALQTPSRANSGGIAVVHLDPLGDLRQPNYQQFDFRVDRRFQIGRMTLRPSLDIFNSRTRARFSPVAVCRRRPTPTRSPGSSHRVARFGVSVQW